MIPHIVDQFADIGIVKRCISHCATEYTDQQSLGQGCTRLLVPALGDDAGALRTSRRLLRRATSERSDDIFGQLSGAPSAPKRRKSTAESVPKELYVQLGMIVGYFNYTESGLQDRALEMLAAFEEAQGAEEDDIPEMFRDLFSHDNFGDQAEAMRKWQKSVASFKEFFNSIQQRMTNFQVWQAKLQTTVPASPSWHI